MRAYKLATKRPRPPTIALGAGLLVAAGVGGFLWASNPDSDHPRAAPRPETGVACPGLRKAFAYHQSGNFKELRRSVATAAAAGTNALDRSGQVFGRPEEIAIELDYLLTQARSSAATDVANYFRQVRVACEHVGRWAADD